MRLLSFKELTKEINITLPTLTRLVKDGLLTEYKIPGGNHRRYNIDELVDLLRGKKEDSR
jgi:excisionase family DNA binding protein